MYTDIICAECTDDDPSKNEDPARKGYYEFRWNPGPTKRKQNHNGTTGWATLLYTTNTNPSYNKLNAEHRFHVCANSPCNVRHPLSKYGHMPEPTHVRLVPKRENVAVAEPSSSAVASLEAAPEGATVAESSSSAVASLEAAPEGSAVAESSSSAVASSETATEEAAVTEPSGSAVASSETVPEEAMVTETSPEGEDMTEVHTHPKSAPLSALVPPAPAAPVSCSNVACDVDAVASAPDNEPAVAARDRIEARLLKLAREIRSPRAYVGYAAFILMGLLKKCRPRVYEGAAHIDLLKVFAPWATNHCTTELAVVAVPCALKATPNGLAELMPVCEEYPLSSIRHFVGGVGMEETAGSATSNLFETMYASMGVGILSTVLDGDCAFDVQTLMLGIDPIFECRKALRIEVSDYLLDRIGEPWVHDIMVACQELDWDDVHALRACATGVSPKPIAPPAVAAAIADAPAVAEVAKPDEETLEAMRWASTINNDNSLLALIEALPKKVVEEQVVLYRKRDQAMAATQVQPQPKKIWIGSGSRYETRMQVAQRFHDHLTAEGIDTDRRLPYGEMKRFIQKHLHWTTKGRTLQTKSVQKWYMAWRTSSQVVSVTSGPALQGRESLVKAGNVRHCRTDCRIMPMTRRRRAPGGGAKFKVPCVRDALYEWFVGLRYGIDWQRLAAERRSRGSSRLCRLPRSLITAKANQLVLEYVQSSLLSGEPAVAVHIDSHWHRKFEEQYGLCMRQANRKYAVPRPIVKERQETNWVNIFRVRYLIVLAFGYDPLLLNFDQSPFHHNETGSQNKPTLAVKCSVVPVVEGNSDVKSRWTANLTVQSHFPNYDPGNQLSRFPFPAAECMFKAESQGAVDKRLQAFRKSRNFPPWLTVTVGPKGSYRDADVIEWLKRHLEPWMPGRDLRIYLCDDYKCHKTKNVWNYCWQCGYIHMVRGGGTTPIGQPPDTDLNEFVRAAYSHKESAMLMDKMRGGQVVPSLSHEECMTVMLGVLSDPALHIHASKGFKKVGDAVDLHGKEDLLICREAGVLWNEPTTDGYPNMRAKIDAELQDLKEEFDSGGITFCERDVKRLIDPYPKHDKVDRVLENLGEDFYHDSVHRLENSAELSAVATEDADAQAGEDDSTSDGADSNDEREDFSTIAAASDHLPAVAASEVTVPREDIVPVRAYASEQVGRLMDTIHALQGNVEGLRAVGCVRAVQCLEFELTKARRRLRAITQENESVLNNFNSLRRAENLRRLEQDQAIAERKEKWRDAQRAIAAEKEATKQLQVKRQKLQELESVTACKHAIKNFTLEELGKGTNNAGGVKGRKNRWEVLDRIARLKAGLSAGQRNDWQWFKEAWDKAMVTEHGADWPEQFATWMQQVLTDPRSNAFSIFVYNETCRVFKGAAALQVPGG